MRARSGDGSIAIQARPGSSTDADWDITSGDGAVTLQLPDGFNADLEAHTGDGGIRLDGVSVTSSGTITRNSVRGRLGSGGRSVRVRTGDGSITLRRQRVGAVQAFQACPFVNRTLAYSVGSSMPASTNASCRSRHLLHVPQCPRQRLPGDAGDLVTGLMHESVSSNGTPSAAPRRMTSVFSTCA